jgi:hypothetical protein
MNHTLRSLADPLLEDVPMPYCVMLHALGVPVEFQSNHRLLIELAEEAYRGLPAAIGETSSPLHVRLLVNDDLPKSAFDLPPLPMMYSHGDTVIVAMSQADMGFGSLSQGRAMVTISPAMAQFPYNVRYELIEFVVYRLATYRLGAVGLHAACVAKGDASLVLVGPSGSGKSTLVFALMQAGWDLIAEDGLFILPDRDFVVRGVPNFVHLMDDALSMFDGHPIKGQRILRRSGRDKLEVDARQLMQSARHMPRIEAPLSDLIFIDFSHNGATTPQLRPINRDQTKRRIAAQQLFATRHAAWPIVLDALLNHPSYVLQRGTSVRDSVQLLSRLTQQ